MSSKQNQQNTSDCQVSNETNATDTSLLNTGDQFTTDQNVSKYILDLDEFTIIKQIGIGGFAEVFLVENKTTKKQYAAKVSLIDSNDQKKKRFFF